ncbi:MAG: hypothetical protein HDR51_07190 [Treponema sp.]|nr:hypothetical protein [Treponema sp.]MBD5408296.1 hypothetical protein [Treponema sp.]MBD5412511.1 hypothetical protein [Treponema sp.]
MTERRIINSALCFALTMGAVFSEGTENQKKFIKGNIIDKTAIVTNALESEAPEFSRNAIHFSINYRPMLGEDRELSALALSGVLTLPAVYVDSRNNEEQNEISDEFYSLYTLFSDETLRIAILHRLVSLNLPGQKFLALLNQQLQDKKIVSEFSALSKTIISTLGKIGNSDSFAILFSCIDKKEYSVFNEELKEAASALMEDSLSQLVVSIQRENFQQCKKIFDLCAKNEKKSKNFRAEIAENVLSRTIILLGNSDSEVEKIFPLQKEAFAILAEQKRTKASHTAMIFFNNAKKFYQNGKISGDDFASIIKGLPYVAPLNCVAPLGEYLQEINDKMGKSEKLPDESVILSIINSLGAIGDKMAFDSLLSVTYYNYSEAVLKAARDALAGLKW